MHVRKITSRGSKAATRAARMKPRVICHMVSSIDGRTLISRWRPADESRRKVFEYLQEQLTSDAWLVGRVTGQEYSKRESYPAITDQNFPRKPWFARRDASAYGVVLDTHGRIAWGCAEIDSDPIVVVLTESVSDAHLAGLRSDGVSYVFAGERVIDLKLTLEVLNRELNIRQLLVNGGGFVNGAFLREGLIDEISLAIFPAIDGAQGAPCVFDSTSVVSGASAPLRTVTLESSQVLESGAVWLRYKVENGPE
jgi:riboflavin biosynthesis pyrimidine reductase